MSEKLNLDNDFKFKKNFGQNFISDTNLLNAICKDANLCDEDEVLEIGAGAGTLTKAISLVAQKCVSYEIDKTLKQNLEEKLANVKNVELNFKDIIKENFEEIEKKFKKNYKIIANLPYYITTQLIFLFLENSTKVNSITIMVQKEVAEKIIAKPNSANYGVLSVMCNYYCDTKICRIVKKQMFKPMPKIDSAIINLKIKSPLKNKEYDMAFKKFIQSSFSMRRKTLLNNLQNAYSLSKEKLNNFFEKNNINPSIRAESFSVGQFIDLFNSFKNLDK